MSALREIFARFGVDFDAGPLAAGNAATEGLTDRLRSLGEVVAGAAVVVGLRNFVADVAHVGDELDKASQALGMSTRSLQEWRAAAGHAGVGAEQFTPALQSLRRNADAARMGAAGMRADFRQLGVDLRDEAGNLRSTDDLMRQVADGIQAMDDPTRAAALAMRLLGESGARLMPLFANGSAGVDEAAAAFQRLGGGMSEEAIAASAAYTDRMQDLNDAMTGVKSRIAVEVLPVLSRLVEGMSRGVAALSRMADQGRILEAAFVVLGGAALAASAQTIAGWIAAAAPFVALGVLLLGLILIVEDLAVGFEGGRSALGEWGDGFQEWAESATGAMEPVAGMLMFIRDTIRVVVNEIADFLGMGDDVLGLYQAAPRTPEEQARELERARAEGARRRAEREAREAARAAGGAVFTPAGGVLDVPALGGAGAVGGADRVLGSLGGTARPAEAPQVRQEVSIGQIVVPPSFTQEQAAALVRREVTSALTAQADDTLDVLTYGGGS